MIHWTDQILLVVPSIDVLHCNYCVLLQKFGGMGGDDPMGGMGGMGGLGGMMGGMGGMGGMEGLGGMDFSVCDVFS